MGAVQAAALMDTTYLITIPNGIFQTDITGANRIAGVQFHPGGLATQLTGNPVSPTVLSIANKWAKPNSGSPAVESPKPGDLFDLFAVLSSGTLDAGSAFIDQWTPLDSFAPQFSINSSTFRATSLTFTIRNRLTGISVAFGSTTIQIANPA